MHFTRITLLPIRSSEKISHSLKKMVEENNVNFIFGGDDAPQPDSKRQKLLECVLTGNSKLYLDKVYTEE